MILITVFPFYWMLRTAFSTSKSLFTDPASLLPVDFTTGAFERVLGLATTGGGQGRGRLRWRRSTSGCTCATR